MSNELLNLCWPVDLASGEKFVLVTIADAINDKTKICAMTADTIAYRTGLTVRSVQRFLANLKEKCLLYINERVGRSSEFTINDRALLNFAKAKTWLDNQKTKLKQSWKKQIFAIEATIEKDTPAYTFAIAGVLGLENNGVLAFKDFAAKVKACLDDFKSSC